MTERESSREENALEENALAWVRRNFRKALYRNYRDPDGGRKYLEISREQEEGCILIDAVTVGQMARYVIEAEPDFQSKSRKEVVRSLEAFDAEHQYRLGPFLKRFRRPLKRT